MFHRAREMVVLAAAGGAVALLAPAAHAADTPQFSHYLAVKGSGSAVSISHQTLESGPITFKLSTSRATAVGEEFGSQLLLFQLKGAATLDEVYGDFLEEFTQDPAVAAKGTRDLTEDADFRGLGDVRAGHPVTVYERLAPGTYYLVDLAVQPTGPPTATTLTVVPTDNAKRTLVPATVSVRGTSADVFLTKSRWDRTGVVKFANTSDTIHFMEITPVQDGTTDAQIQAFFDSGSQTPPTFFRDGHGYALEALSPGRQVHGAYDLAPGTYVLLCFVSDDTTGMPHALMGMHKVITVA